MALPGDLSPPHPLLAIAVGALCGALAMSRITFGLLGQPAPWRAELVQTERGAWVALVVDASLQSAAGGGIDREWTRIAADRGLRCPTLRRLMLRELDRNAVEHIVEMAAEQPPLAIIMPLDIAFPGRKALAGVGVRPRGPNEGTPITEGRYVHQEDKELLVRELRDRATEAFALLDVAPSGTHLPAWSEAQRQHALQVVGGNEQFIFRPQPGDEGEHGMAAAIAEWLCVPR